MAVATAAVTALWWVGAVAVAVMVVVAVAVAVAVGVAVAVAMAVAVWWRWRWRWWWRWWWRWRWQWLWRGSPPHFHVPLRWHYYQFPCSIIHPCNMKIRLVDGTDLARCGKS